MTPDRSAETGEYVSAETAAANPATTVHETEKPKRSFIPGIAKKEMLALDSEGGTTSIQVESVGDCYPQMMRLRVGQGEPVLADEETLLAILHAAVASRHYIEGADAQRARDKRLQGDVGDAA